MEERDDFPGMDASEIEAVGIDPRFVVSLKGKSYPTWPGVLDAATRMGIKSLTTTIVQIPSPENGHLAVVLARLEMTDGRVYEDVGDCSPASASAQLASAALRFASTRAKGRVCRDCINCGMTLAEELPGAEHRGGYSSAAPAAPAARPAAPAPGNAVGPHCSDPDCGKPITKNEQTRSQHHYHVDLCRDCFPKYEPNRSTAEASN